MLQDYFLSVSVLKPDKFPEKVVFVSQEMAHESENFLNKWPDKSLNDFGKGSQEFPENSRLQFLTGLIATVYKQ